MLSNFSAGQRHPSSPYLDLTYRHVRNRLATASAEHVDLVVKIFQRRFVEKVITFEEAVVVGNVNTEGRGVRIDLVRVSKQ